MLSARVSEALEHTLWKIKVNVYQGARWHFPSINHVCNKYLFSNHRVPGTMLDSEDTMASKTRKDPRVR